MIKELRRRYPLANVVAIDYDPGASEVNQLNRIKLMLSTANKNLSKNKMCIRDRIMEAILSGKYDTDKIAVIISQTGGGCRASNYIGFIPVSYTHLDVYKRQC